MNDATDIDCPHWAPSFEDLLTAQRRFEAATEQQVRLQARIDEAIRELGGMTVTELRSALGTRERMSALEAWERARAPGDVSVFSGGGLLGGVGSLLGW